MPTPKQIGLLLLGLALNTQGQTLTNESRPLSLQDCMQAALLHNRDIQIERFEPVFRQLDLKGSYGYYDPAFKSGVEHGFTRTAGSYNSMLGVTTPGFSDESYSASAGFTGYLPSGMSYSLSGDYRNDFGSSESFNTFVGISITQPLLKDFWIDAGRLAIKVSKHSLKFSELGVEYVVMNVMAQVQDAYYELIYAREFVRVEEKLLQVRQRYYDETKRKVEVGTLPQLEEKLAQSEVAKVQAALISARNNVELRQNALKTLLGDDFVSSVGVTIIPTDSLMVLPETMNLQESWQRGLSKRPDVAQTRVTVQIAEANLKYRWNQLFPALDFVASYGLRGVSTSSSNRLSSASDTLGQIRGFNNPSEAIGVIFSMPIGRVNERASYASSKESRAQAMIKLKKLEELVLRQIDDAVKNVKTSLESVAATRLAREYAQAALEAEEKKLAAGRSTLYVVLQLQGDLAATASAELRAKANYNQALAQLYFVEGTTLDRSRFTLEIK